MSTVNESSTCTFRVRFFDTSDAPATPTTVHYKVYDVSNQRTVRNWTAVSTAEYVDIQIDAADHDIFDDTKKFQKHTLTVQANQGLATQYSDEFAYTIKNLSAFT